MQWHKTYGELNCDLNYYEWLAPYPAVETDDGGYAIVSSTASFGAGDVDVWLIKTDSEGNVQWYKTYGGSKAEYASSVVKTRDGGYLLAGWTESFGAGGRDSWLVKTDSQGNMQWNKTYGGVTYDYFFSAVQTHDGGYVATKSIQDSVGGWFFSADVVKIDASGNVEGNIKYPSTTDMMRMDARFIIETNDGGYVFTGSKTTADDPHVAKDYVWLVKIGGNPIPPTISILRPKNKTYTVNSVPLTFNLGEPTSWIAYSLDGQANVTINGNTTLTGLSDGSHSLIVYSNDTAGNTGTSETIYFSIEPFPTTWIAAAIVIIAIGGATFLVYFAKIRKTTGKAEK